MASLGGDESLGLPLHMQNISMETTHYDPADTNLRSLPEGLPSFKDYKPHHHVCVPLDGLDESCDTHDILVRTKSAPRMGAREAGGIDSSKLNSTINEEMVDLKMFLKAERRDAAPDADSNIKKFYRDKYRQKYVKAMSSSEVAASPAAEESPRSAASRPAASLGVSGVYNPRGAVDSTLGRQHAEAQVGAQENVGWVPQMPDGWGKGYTYSYSKDNIPSIARGVPLPATFGGRGGGGKKTSHLGVQEEQAKNEYERRHGRASAQHSGEWVTWGNAFAPDERCGVAPSRHCQSPGSVGKRGRCVKTDAAQSLRGGQVVLTPSRMGMHAPAEQTRNGQYQANFRESARRAPAVQGWYGPSGHADSAHPVADVRRDPSLHMRSEFGVSNLGGGKMGRNHLKEYRGSQEDNQAWLSPQSRPQMGEYGTRVGGGAKGRNNNIDARQSSNQGPLIC
eukprot:TRINITY_DN10724_c0_g1_i2.p1 TRINITY_DN10724_c0_g1~~TRINITY_DN10724_c0_g1_i2.p1  ORF type:complete len:451 (-),score=76.19 TRINITY_DN10724_c0_g1_i2:286-1638(-)